MDHDLYAFVVWPGFGGRPIRTRVFVATYNSKQLAQWWAINIKRVWMDPQKTLIATENIITGFEIVPTPS